MMQHKKESTGIAHEEVVAQLVVYILSYLVYVRKGEGIG